MVEHQVFGDWRDLRSAIDATDPGFSALENDERERLWLFAERVVANYAPMKVRCVACREVVGWSHAYRCADCNAVCCDRCIKRHFGPQHRPHNGAPTSPPVPAVTREELVEIINRELRSYELRGGNILDAIATYHNDETVKEALEIVGDWSVWLAETIISRLNPTEPK